MNATQGGVETSVDIGAADVGNVKPRRTRIDSLHEQPRETDGSPLLAEAETQRSSAPLGLAEQEKVLLEVEEPTAEMIAAVAGEHPEIRREQLQLQVAQLAGHLRERLREVDRREATLNARVAQLENDLRVSRLWLSERELTFQERENELKQQVDELHERLEARRDERNERELAIVDAEAAAAELSERELQIRTREDEVRERRFEVDRQAAALRHSQQLWEQERERQANQLHAERRQLETESAQWREQLERETTEAREQREQEQAEYMRLREEQLQAAESLISEQATSLDHDREAMIAERIAWDEQKRRQKQAIDELRQTAEDELADRRNRLEARQQWIERQKAGLEQVRDEALRLHRQSLEMRLLAEQLWAQITASLAPAEVTQAIAELRLKLSEQYKIEEQLLVGRRDELLKLSEKIAQQHREVELLRDGVRQWGFSRQAEIERQASALVQRELTLDQQQDAFKDRELAWHGQRRHYEQQIRELTSRMRSLPVAA